MTFVVVVKFCRDKRVTQEKSEHEPTVDPLESPSDSIPVAVVQFSPAPNASDNLESIRAFVEAAVGAGAKLVVFPEYSHAFAGALGEWVTSVAEPIDGPFVTELITLSAQTGAAIVTGMLEKGSEDQPHNTLVAVHPERGLVGRYRKVHLYDAFGAMESDWISAGSASEAPVVVELAGLQVGLQTCYDLRFPEVSRRLVDAGATVLAIPSEWLAGPKKAHHWVALTAARAIENLCYVVAADQIAPVAVGMSRIISPLGETLIDMGQEAGIAIAFISPSDLLDARATKPALDMRMCHVAPNLTCARFASRAVTLFYARPVRNSPSRRSSSRRSPSRASIISATLSLIGILTLGLAVSAGRPAAAVSGIINDGGVDIGDDYTWPGSPGDDGSDGSPGSGGGSWLGPYLPGIPWQLARAYCLSLLAPPLWCYDTPGTDPTPSEPAIPDLTLPDLSRVEPRSPELVTEPSGWSVINVETNLIARISPHVVSTQVFDTPVEVLFTPVRYEWAYGDGESGVTDVPGSSWAALGLAEFSRTPTSHRYARPIGVIPHVDVVYRVDYRWRDLDWMLIDGTLTRGGDAPIVFLQNAATVLVTSDCRRKPDAIGCSG